jgi:predicted nuclease with TOPRIM domain
LKHRRTLQIGNTKHNEILGGISFDDLNKVIQEIIHQIEYSSENYIKLWKILQDTKEENKSLTERNKVLSQECSHIQSELQELVNTIQSSSSESLYKLKKENKKLTNEVYKIKREFKAYVRNHPFNSTLDEYVQDISSSAVTENMVTTPTDLDRRRLRVFQRQRDGNYHINGKIYSVLTGTREEVWNDVAYRTSGGLAKDDFVIGYHGNIVSKKKHEYCHHHPQLPILISKSLVTHTD